MTHANSLPECVVRILDAREFVAQHVDLVKRNDPFHILPTLIQVYCSIRIVLTGNRLEQTGRDLFALIGFVHNSTQRTTHRATKVSGLQGEKS